MKMAKSSQIRSEKHKISSNHKPTRKLISSVLSPIFITISLISPIGGTIIAKADTSSNFVPPQAAIDHLKQDDWGNIQGILANIYGSVTSPLKISDIDKGSYTTGQLLGNGDIGTIAAGVSTTSQQFYFGKNDFWGTLHAQGSSVKDNQGILSCGGLDIWPTTAAGSNASTVFNMKQDILNAQVITNMQLKDNSGNDANIQMNSWTADTDNVFVTEIANNGQGDIILNTKQWVPAMAYASSSATDLTDATNTYPYTGGIDTTGPNPVLWTTRDTNAGSTGNTSGFRSRLATATTVVGAELTNTQEKIEANDYYDSNKGKYYNSLGEAGDFTVPAGGTVDVVTYFTTSSGAYQNIKSVSDVQQAAVSGIAAYTTQDAIVQLKNDHLNWWKNYWLKSYVQFNDSSLNKYYYGSLYIQGCANRTPSSNGKVNPQNLPGSMYGPWVPADNVGWGGRYFLNYNQEAEYYAAGSTNRIDTALPYDNVIAYDLPWQMNNAAAQGYDGVVHNRTLSPFDVMVQSPPSLNSKSSTMKYGFSSGSTDQKSNGMFAAVPMLFYYEYTLDNNYLKTVLYPYYKQLLTFYSEYVLKTDDGNGQYHYSVIGSSIHEGDAADINPDLDTGAIKLLSNFLILHASEMNEDPANIIRWQDLNDHTVFPEEMLPQGIFSANNNSNFVPTITATDYQSPNQAHVDMIEPGDQPVELEGVVFPFENVQVLDGNKELLQKVLNTLNYMNAWSASGFSGWSSQNNGFCKVYPIAARAGWPAADLLSKLETALASKVRNSNLTYYQSGGAVETIGAMEGLDSMLIQSETTPKVPSTIMVFPNWDMSRSVDFERLGAKGNVEVSSAYDAATQTIPYVDLSSKRDGEIALVNPWTVGRPVIQVVNSNNTLGDIVNYTISGGKIIFDAQNGTRYMVMDDTTDTTLHVSGITFDKYSGTLIYNGTNGADTTTITATTVGNPNDTVKWTSSDNNIVTVTDNGNNTATIKAVGAGSSLVVNAIITATSTQDPEITQTYNVKVADVSTVPTSLTMISPSTATIYGPASTDPSTDKVSGNDRLQLTATIQPSNAYDKRIMWTSSNQNIAMIDKNGLVIARGQGTATITGTSMANPSLTPITCTVTVTAAGDDYSADSTLASVINASKSISAYSGNTTGSGGFTQVSNSPNWTGMQESFQKALINALGVKSKYSGYATYNISKDTAYFAAIALNEAIKTIDPAAALEISNTADKTALTAAINSAVMLTADNFNTTQDWNDLQNALTAAQAVNNNANAQQSDVDSAISALNAAMAKVIKTGGSIPAVSVTTGSATIYGGHLVQLNASGTGLTWSVTNADGSPTTNAIIDPNGGLLMAASEGTYKATVTSSSGEAESIMITFSNMAPMPNLTFNGNGNGSAFGSTSSGSYPPKNSFDGSASTFYDHSTSAPYVGWDFGPNNAKVINVLKFMPRSGSNALRATGAILQGSNDNKNYDNLYTVIDTFSPSTTQPWYIKAINNTTAYRYYRWLGINGSHGNVAEIQLYLNVDKTALATAISDAEALIGSKTVGEVVGNVPQAAVDAFQSVIDAAIRVNTNTAATQDKIDAQVAALAEATAAFNNAVIKVTLNQVTLTSDKTILGLKDTAQLTLSGTMSDGKPADLTNATVIYTVDNPEIATVSATTGAANAVITPLKEGKAYVTATVTMDGVTCDSSLEIDVDTTPPTITITGITDGEAIKLNEKTPVVVTWTASDEMSGVDSATGDITSGTALDVSKVGSHTLTFTAVDKVGNAITKSITYYVQYDYSGLLAPVSSDGSSTFKLGSTVPVKFQLKDANGIFVTDAVANLYVAQVMDNEVGPGKAAVSTSAASSGNTFRYDSTSNQYIFNLNTKDLTAGTIQIRIDLGDGTSNVVKMELR